VLNDSNGCYNSHTKDSFNSILGFDFNLRLLKLNNKCISVLNKENFAKKVWISYLIFLKKQ
jgi:hypothetical protein